MKILSQRNPEWADVQIGKSTETVGRKGCLLTDNSAITDYIGHYRDPKWMAQNLDYTKEGLFIWASITRAKLDFVYRFYSWDDVKIRKAFKDPDQFIVIQVDSKHWVWLIGMAQGYRVMDPWYGDIINLFDRYRKITGFAILERQDEDEWTTGDEANSEESVIAGDSIDFLALGRGTKFVDLSHWNEIVDLSRTKSAGYKGAIHKCSQGISNKDSAYIQNKARIRELDMAFGAYHFADAGDPIKEADWFLKNIGEMKHGDLLILDYETYARADADDWCLKWMNYVKEKTGHAPLLYTYHGLLNHYQFPKVAKAGYRLWAARYGLQEQEPNEKYKPTTGAFGKMFAWQYCSQGEVPGINKRVDLNIIV
jgi:lysozyme